MRKLILVLGLLVALTGTALAKDWQIDAAHSSLSFAGEQNGEKFTGGFKKFDAQVSLDPEHPETGKIVVTVSIASAYAGSDDRDQLLPQTDWFDSAKFPQAQFASTSIRKTSPGHYEAAATLTLKGVTRSVVLPFTLVPEGDHWRAQGKVILMRNDFAIGQGMFSGEEYVKHAVDVGIDLVAR